VLVTVCAALGLVMGWLLPDLIRRLPERSTPGDPGVGAEPEAGRAQLSTLEPTYVAIASARALRPTLAVTTAAVFVLLGSARGAHADLPAFLAVGAFGVALAYVDLRRHRLPDALTYPALAAGALLLGAAAVVDREWGDFLPALLGALALRGFYRLLAMIRPADMGMGDVKLAAVLGLYLGWLGWDILLLGAFLGFLIGGLVGLVLLALRRAALRTAVPFGPSMLAGALVAVVWGADLVDLYLGR
jgi:leader peptidase (prepilin peptidase)/N-methyltransferase